MLIGLIEFERTKGARDKKKRRRRNLAIATGAGIGTGTAVISKGLEGVGDLFDTLNYWDLYDSKDAWRFPDRYKRNPREEARLLNRDLLRRKIELRVENLQKTKNIPPIIAKKAAVPITYIKDGFIPGIKSGLKNKPYLLGSAIAGGLIGQSLYRRKERKND